MYECYLVNIKSHISDLTAKGVIKSFIDNTAVIELYENHDFITGEKLTFKIYTKNDGYFVYDGNVKYCSDNFLSLCNISLDDKIQRRTSKRVAISKTNSSIKSVIINNNKLLQLKNDMFMKAKDISYSGILLESPLDIPMDVNFLINLRVYSSSITLKTTTVRKYSENNLIYYGCTFELINPNDKDLLLSYLNKNILSQLYDNSNISLSYTLI